MEESGGAGARLLPGRIRLVEVRDLERVLEIYNHSVLHTDATLDTEPKTRADIEVWHAEHAGRYCAAVLELESSMVVGYGALSPFARRGGYFPLAEVSVYLMPAHVGRGHGTRLLSWLVQEAGRRGFATLIAFITTTNIASIKLFERLGFVHTGSMRQAGYKLDRFVDLDLYQRFLRDPAAGPPPGDQLLGFRA